MEYVIIGLLIVVVAAYLMRDKISEKVKGLRSKGKHASSRTK